MDESAKAGYYRDMESRNARFLRQGLIEKYRKMTPVQRVKAFVEHSRRMKGLRDAGELRRKSLGQGKTGHG